MDAIACAGPVKGEHLGLFWRLRGIDCPLDGWTQREAAHIGLSRNSLAEDGDLAADSSFVHSALSM